MDLIAGHEAGHRVRPVRVPGRRLSRDHQRGGRGPHRPPAGLPRGSLLANALYAVLIALFVRAELGRIGRGLREILPLTAAHLTLRRAGYPQQLRSDPDPRSVGPCMPTRCCSADRYRGSGGRPTPAGSARPCCTDPISPTTRSSRFRCCTFSSRRPHRGLPPLGPVAHGDIPRLLSPLPGRPGSRSVLRIPAARPQSSWTIQWPGWSMRRWPAGAPTVRRSRPPTWRPRSSRRSRDFWARRWVGWVLTVPAVLLCIGVVYCQMHYGVGCPGRRMASRPWW